MSNPKMKKLSLDVLATCSPISGNNGKDRALCPFHGSDNQRSLSVDRQTGRFKCYQCGAWGYLDKSREKSTVKAPNKQPESFIDTKFVYRPPELIKPAHDDLEEHLSGYQACLPGSPGQQYLMERGITLEVAQKSGIGFAAPTKWLNPKRDCKFGRIVFPHYDPLSKRIINLYGRAAGEVPKEFRHDHLSGSKGIFCLQKCLANWPPTSMFLCEAPFDALSLIAIDLDNVVGLFGADDWRWDWVNSN